MLHLYMNQHVDTTESIKNEIDTIVMMCKRGAHSLDQRIPVGDRFNHELIKFFLYIEEFVCYIEKEDAKIRQFIESSLNKMEDYAMFNQQVIKMIYYVTVNVKSEDEKLEIKTSKKKNKQEDDEGDEEEDEVEDVEQEVTGEKNRKTIEQTLPFVMPRGPIKIDRMSNLNVIKINIDYIDIVCENKAIVTPVSHSTNKIEKSRGNQKKKDVSLIDLVLPTKAIMDRFSKETTKMTIYIGRFHKLINIEKIDTFKHHSFDIISEALKQVLSFCPKKNNETRLSIYHYECDSDIEFTTTIEETLKKVMQCFEKMIDVLMTKRKNTYDDYVKNNIIRFKECSEMYDKMLDFMQVKGIDVTMIKNYGNETNVEPFIESGVELASMFQ